MKFIELTKGKTTTVDDEDYNYLNSFNWHYSTGYAMRQPPRKKGKRTPILMHREITNCPKEKEVDHINGDKLDNRKKNLRICTRSNNGKNQSIQNRQKSSIYKGVSLIKSTLKWRASIKINGKQFNLGHFHTEKDAAIAYNNAAIKYFKEYSKLNVIK